MAKRKIDYAKSEYPNSFKRQGAFPLDETSVKYSKDDLIAYAQSMDEGAYVGQIVTVVPGTKPATEDVAVEAETYVIYSEGGKVNRLVNESELLALNATSSVDETENNLQYISTISQAEGQITASHKTMTAGDNISIKAAKDAGVTTIANTAAYEHSSTGADSSTSNLEYITEVTQSKGQISAKKKTLSGTANNISVTTAANGTTTIKDIAEVKDDTYTDADSKYVAKVTQTDGKIAYEKHTIEGTDNISVSTLSGKTTIKNTAAFSDTAENNKYVSEVDQSKGAISVSRRTILENTVAETANDASTTTSNGDVKVITSVETPTGDKGIIPKQRTIKGAKGIEVIVGNNTSDITVQHTTTVEDSDGNVDVDGKTSTTQTSDNTEITNGGTFTISDVNYDAQGHVTSENTATLTVPKYSGGTGISITLDEGKTNEYTITNSASVNSTDDDTTESKDYIVSVSGINGSITPTKKVLTAGTGITITTGKGSTDADKTKLTIGHSNVVDAKTSYSNIATDDNAQVNIVTPTYDAQGHVTGAVDQQLTVGASTSTKLGTVRVGKDNANYTVDGKTSSISANISNNENYRAVEIDKDDKAFVYAPHTDATVTLSADLYTNYNVGSITNASGTNKVLIGSEGQTLRHVFNKLFVMGEVQPTITEKPSVTCSLTNDDASDERGTVISSASYSITFEDGAYTNESTTGVEMTSYSFSSGTASPTTDATDTTGTLTFASDYTVGTSAAVTPTLTANYSAGNVAKTNLGNNSNPEVMIAASSCTTTPSFSKTAVDYPYFISDSADTVDKLSGKTFSKKSTNLTTTTGVSCNYNKDAYVWIFVRQGSTETQPSKKIQVWSDIAKAWGNFLEDTETKGTITFTKENNVSDTFFAYRTKNVAQAADSATFRLN